MTAAPIRVLLVDDSAVIRGATGRILESVADIKVVTTATNGRQALEALKRGDIDVVLLDVEMPEMDGLTALPLILERHPRVKVIMQSSLTQKGASVTMQALALGAADFITKPTAKGTSGLSEMQQEIVAKVRAIARAPSAPRTTSALAPAPRPPLRQSILGSTESSHPRIIALASSTGGPNALAAVLTGIMPGCQLPVVITQHMPPLFTGLLAQRLGRDFGGECVEATDGMPLRNGVAYVAPGGAHLIVATHEAKPMLRLDHGPPENHCRPAADVMLRSVASVYGASALVIVLTGMGEDGRRGCEVIRQRGGRVIVQDEATSVVWGMPGAVAQAGLANAVLPLDDIAAHVHSLMGVAA